MRALVFILGILCLAGCNSAQNRIAEHQAAYAALDPATQQAIRQGVVRPGFTSAMVYMALGKPTTIATDATGQTIWSYHQEPVTANNETIMSGYRRRVVYDPVKQTNDVIVEPIDTKAFPNLVPHTLRLTFRDDRLVSIERFDR